MILTKEKLAKRRWQASKKCCFCNQEEIIHHLFLACPLVKLLWCTIHVSFSVPSPTSISNMFCNSFGRVEHNAAARIRSEFLNYFEIFGTIEMILCLTKQRFIFSSLSTKRLDGSVCCHYFTMRT